MKIFKSIYLLLLIAMGGCSNPAETSIDYSLMDDIFLSSLEFPGVFSEPIEMYDRFYNEGTSHENQVAYLSFDEPLNYSISKRVTKYLSSRKDKPLPEDLVKSLSRNLNVKLKKDTIISNQPMLLISEPFSIADNIFSFAITRKSVGIDPIHEFWIYFIKENADKYNRYQILTVYDWQKDMLYTVEKLSGTESLVN